jgi:excisionase family DNA binding protein
MNALSTLEELTDAKQAADYLRLKPRAFWRLVAERGLPHYKLNARVFRFRLSELQAWLNSHREGAQ